MEAGTAAAGKEEEEGEGENGYGTSGGSSSGGGAGGDSVHLMLLGPTRPLPFFTELPPPCLEERRVFVSTFNCGECGLQPLVGRLGEWIPKGMAVYVSCVLGWLAGWLVGWLVGVETRSMFAAAPHMPRYQASRP